MLGRPDPSRAAVRRALSSPYTQDVKLTRDGARMVMTMAVGIACAYLGIIGVFGRLNFTVLTTVDMLRIIVNSNLWSAGFLIVAGFIWATLVMNRLQHQAMQLAFAVMAPWAMFDLLWGLSTESPVSLAAPGLAVVVAVIAQALALSWASDADRSSTTTGR